MHALSALGKDGAEKVDVMMSSDTESLAGMRVLLVEDEPAISMLVEDLLMDLGCVVVGPATRVSEALALCSSEPLDCAILDMSLAGETATPIAQDLAARGVAMVFTTGYGDDGVPAEFRDRPILRKPFRQTALADILVQVKKKKG
jgi:CheY-like chemotaxis protein